MNTQQAQARLQQRAAEASALFDKADAEGRQLTPDEREEAEEKVARFKDLQARQQVFGVAERIGTPGMGGLTGGDGRPLASSDPGRAFVESEGYKAISDPATRGQKWSTGAIPVGSLQAKGTLLEGAGAPGAGSGGGFLSPGPTVVPGVVETLFQPIQAVDRVDGSQAGAQVVAAGSPFAPQSARAMTRSPTEKISWMSAVALPSQPSATSATKRLNCSRPRNGFASGRDTSGNTSTSSAKNSTYASTSPAT